MSVVGCGGASLTDSPQLLNVAGKWSGTIDNSADGAGTITLTLAQSGTTVSGSWTSYYPGFIDGTVAGILSGSVSGSSVTVTLFPNTGNSCASAATGTAAGQQMTGTFATVSCSVYAGGTFSVVRQ